MNIFKNLWDLVMNPNVNALKNIANLKVRHMIMQILAFMWSGVFSIYIIDSIYVFGFTAIAHALLIGAMLSLGAMAADLEFVAIQSAGVSVTQTILVILIQN